MANTSQFQMLLTTHLNKVFFGRYKDLPSQYKDYYAVGKTDELYEVGTTVTGLGPVPETREGESPDYDEMGNGFPYVHNTLAYRMGVRVTERLYKSDKYKIFGPKVAQELARSANHTRELLAARPFNQGFSNNGFLSPDAMPFFSTAHPLLRVGGVGANRPSTNAALSIAALQAATTQMRRTVDDAGKILTFRPKKLIITPELEWSARTILQSSLLPGSANNDINTVAGAYELSIWDYITNPTQWMLWDNVNAPDSVVMKDKVPVKTSSHHDWHTDSVLYDVRFEQLLGANEWRGWYGSPGS